MVIYALQNYLINKLAGTPSGLTSDQFIVGGWEPNDKMDAIYLRDQGGATEGYPSNRSDALIQVVTRAKDDFRAMELSQLVFSTLREVFMVDLFLNTSSPIKVSKLGAIQRPSAMGTSTNGLYQYTFTYQVIFSENNAQLLGAI